MRKLKAAKADKKDIDEEVAKLLSLKTKLAAASGTPAETTSKTESAGQKKNKKKK